MDFLDKVKKTAVSVARVSSRESKKLYAVTKLKLEITEKQNKVKALYKEIGYDAYKAHREEKDIVVCIKNSLKAIDKLEDEIEALREKIEYVKSTEEVGVDDFEVEDSFAHEAEIIPEDEEIETEPIEPIE